MARTTTRRARLWGVYCHDPAETHDRLHGRGWYDTIGEARAAARRLNESAPREVLYYAAPIKDLWPHEPPYDDEER